MRRLILAAVFILIASVPIESQLKGNRTNPASTCGDDSAGIPDFYDTAVFDQLHPPDWEKSLIRISVGNQRKLVLWTDGEKFKLWTDTVTPGNIEKFLHDLDRDCRLPPNPAAVTAFLKVKWESVDLSPAEFARIHREFTSASAQYVSKAQGRYNLMMQTKLRSIWLDAIEYTVVYDNNDEQYQVKVIENSKEYGAMLDWIHGLQMLAERSFHRHFGL